MIMEFFKLATVVVLGVVYSANALPMLDNNTERLNDIKIYENLIPDGKYQKSTKCRGTSKCNILSEEPLVIDSEINETLQGENQETKTTQPILQTGPNGAETELDIEAFIKDQEGEIGQVRHYKEENLRTEFRPPFIPYKEDSMDYLFLESDFKADEDGPNEAPETDISYEPISVLEEKWKAGRTEERSKTHLNYDEVFGYVEPASFHSEFGGFGRDKKTDDLIGGFRPF